MNKRFICTCEHGYVRCSAIVAKRGSKCATCENYQMGDGSHKGGYHAAAQDRYVSGGPGDPANKRGI